MTGSNIRSTFLLCSTSIFNFFKKSVLWLHMLRRVSCYSYPSLQKSKVTWLTWSSDISDRDELYGHKTRQRNKKIIYYTHLFTLLCLVKVLIFLFFLEKRDLFPSSPLYFMLLCSLSFFFLLCSLVPWVRILLLFLHDPVIPVKNPL